MGGKDMDMETILEETVATEDLKKFEQKYHVELNNGKVSSESQFEYAWCSVRSRYPADIRKGIILLEDLFQNRDNSNKRDYLYYLAKGEHDVSIRISDQGGGIPRHITDHTFHYLVS